MKCVACGRGGTALTHGAFCPHHWRSVPTFIRRRLAGETSPAVVFSLIKSGLDFIKRNMKQRKARAA